jgi:hypothetical protein
LDFTPVASGLTDLGGFPPALIMNDLASDGSVIGFRDSGGSPNVRRFYLRLPTGVETQITGIDGVNAVNSQHVVAGVIRVGNIIHAAIWTNGTVTDLNTLLPPNSGFTLFDALAIRDAGDIVGIGGHNNKQVGFLLSTSASVSIKFGTLPQVQTGKIVDVQVTVTAGAVDLSSVSLGDGLAVSGNHAKVERQAADISGFSLSAGASRTFTFKVKGLSEGDAGLSVSAAASSSRGKVTDSATEALKIWNPRLDVLRVKVPGERDPKDTIDLEYRGLGWDPTGGEINLRFSGENAGRKAQAATFDGTLKIRRSPKRTTDRRAIRDRAGGGYCWGEFSASQGGLFNSNKVEGKWQGVCCGAPTRRSRRTKRGARARTTPSSPDHPSRSS